MRLDKEKPDYENIEDHRGSGGRDGGRRGGFGFPRGSGFPGSGGRVNIPMGGRGGGLSLKTIIILVAIYFILKLMGIDLLQAINGGQDTGITLPDGSTEVTDQTGLGGGTGTVNVDSDAGKEFVARVLGSTRRIWTGVFQSMNRKYEPPKLVLFSGFDQSACGMAQSAMGPFYCPPDRKVYIDLSFYQDMKTKLGAPGDFAQAYVIAHEVGHHVQNLLGIADKVMEQRRRVSEEDSNALSVKMELQADCLAGFWAAKADATAQILEQGDLEEALNAAAAAIGDDRLQKRSQGYAVPDTFTHGTSAQRVRWFKQGFGASSIQACDTFSAGDL